MLLKLTDPVSECLRRAEECRRRAKTAMGAASIEHHLKMEQRWLFLASSRQFAERIGRFIAAQTRRSTPLP
jgi:hypothetical protein